MGEKTVYIIDDQLGIRLLLKEIIEMEGYAVKEYEKAADALRHISNDRPDLLFVDFNLPLMDGMEFIKKAYEEMNQNVPSVIMSGYTIDELKPKLDMNLVTKVLSKPFDVTDITDLLHLHLNEQ